MSWRHVVSFFYESSFRLNSNDRAYDNRLETDYKTVYFFTFFIFFKNTLVPLVFAARAPKFSLPEKFKGQHSRFRDFLISVENIFALDPSRFPSQEVQVRFIGTLLADEALSWFRSLALSHDKAYLLRDYNSFILEFRQLVATPGQRPMQSEH